MDLGLGRTVTLIFDLIEDQHGIFNAYIFCDN